ncbi:hypothetical protein HMPREF0063_10361 [Aeromicrobium marinum DSM 15272]|uniref:Uncharacterized protein n=1 Tax=Aeromicrobium marinum DSM 15272 TaxID=585531 RepID=E2S8K4_9ACTN|nr:hypothetical protein HMPREF0063_10361 [Aeromicrobium marinum DSM 15272]
MGVASGSFLALTVAALPGDRVQAFASPSERGRERSEAKLGCVSVASGSFLALTVAALPGDRVHVFASPRDARPAALRSPARACEGVSGARLTVRECRLGLVPRPHGRCAPWRPGPRVRQPEERPPRGHAFASPSLRGRERSEANPA